LVPVVREGPMYSLSEECIKVNGVYTSTGWEVNKAKKQEKVTAEWALHIYLRKRSRSWLQRRGVNLRTKEGGNWG